MTSKKLTVFGNNKLKMARRKNRLLFSINRHRLLNKFMKMSLNKNRFVVKFSVTGIGNQELYLVFVVKHLQLEVN